MRPIIIPTILVPTFDEFSLQIEKLFPLFKLVQIDVMDGIFVDNKSFDDVDKINQIANLPDLELHLMVEHPLHEIEKWEKIKNVKKIIFHIESKDDPIAVCNSISGICSQSGIALKPGTPLTAVNPYLDRVTEVLFLAVNPGRQGNPFLPEVGDKIKELAGRPVRPIIGVDGGINEKNIGLVRAWGAEIFCVGSALTGAKNLKKVYNNLLKQLI